MAQRDYMTDKNIKNLILINNEESDINIVTSEEDDDVKNN